MTSSSNDLPSKTCLSCQEGSVNHVKSGSSTGEDHSVEIQASKANFYWELNHGSFGHQTIMNMNFNTHPSKCYLEN